MLKFSEHLMDPATGLFDHAWFVNAGEADPAFHWARGDAWVVMAMAELLSVMPETHPDRPKVLELFRRTVRGHVPFQSPTGFWHQLIDRSDSYLETSATAMYTFAIARGVNRGWLPPIYARSRRRAGRPSRSGSVPTARSRASATRRRPRTTRSTTTTGRRGSTRCRATAPC